MKAKYKVGDIVKTLEFSSEIVRVEKRLDTYFYYLQNGCCCSERNILGYL